MRARSTKWLTGIAAIAGLQLWGCAKQPSTPDAGSVTDGGGADGGLDAGLGCADPASPPNPSCGTLAWSTSSSVSRLRNHHVGFIAQSAAGAFLYSLGGYNAGAILDNSDMAPINADGSLGAWTATTALPNPTGGLTGAPVGNVVVVAGGDVAGDYTDQSYYAPLQSDGTLGAWVSGGSVLNPRMHAGSFVSGNTIYVMGGFDNQQVWGDIVAASVRADGTLSPWVTAGALPAPRSHFSVNLVGDYVYITGGLNQSALDDPPELTDVERGTLAPDGTLGNWIEMPALPVALATHSGFVYGGYLYVGGGINETASGQENRIWSSPIAADGTLGAWQLSTPLPIARGHVHQLPFYAGRVYSVAGAIDFNLDSTGEIDVGQFE